MAKEVYHCSQENRPFIQIRGSQIVDIGKEERFDIYIYRVGSHLYQYYRKPLTLKAPLSNAYPRYGY